jgi:hypothetical protein
MDDMRNVAKPSIALAALYPPPQATARAAG